MSLTGLFTGEVTWQEFDAMLAKLPPESAYRTEVRDSFTDEELADLIAANTDEKHGPWSRAELLLTSLVWELRKLNYIQISRGGIKDAPVPEPIPTPGQIRKSKPKADPEGATWLEEIRARNRAARLAEGG